MPRTFRSKTLAGRVRARAARAPESQLCLLRTHVCFPWTAVAASLLCHGGRVDAIAYGRRLAELKSDLRDALTEVQVHEKAIAGPVAQAGRLALDELEAGLKEILQQVEQEKRKGTR